MSQLKIDLIQGAIYLASEGLPAGQSVSTATLDLSQLSAAQIADPTVGIRIAIETQRADDVGGPVWHETSMVIQWQGGQPLPAPLAWTGHARRSRLLIEPNQPLRFGAKFTVTPATGP